MNVTCFKSKGREAANKI